MTEAILQSQVAEIVATTQSAPMPKGFLLGRDAHRVARSGKFCLRWYHIFVSTFTQALAWVIARALLFVCAKVEVRGRENLTNLSQGVIFAANHMNDIDAVLMRTALPVFSRFAPVFVVARQMQDYTWRGWKAFIYSDWFFRILGAYPAFKGTNNYAHSLRLFTSIAEKKQTIVIFAGGQQNTATEPVTPRGGTGYLAHATGFPVVPVAIEGTFGFSVLSVFKKRPHIIISYGAPRTKEQLFKAGELGANTYKDATTLIVQDIETMRHVIREGERGK